MKLLKFPGEMCGNFCRRHSTLFHEDFRRPVSNVDGPLIALHTPSRIFKRRHITVSNLTGCYFLGGIRKGAHTLKPRTSKFGRRI